MRIDKYDYYIPMSSPKKSDYELVGGLDESFAVSLNDVDFCLKLRSKGYRNVWTPFAQLNIEPASQTSANNGDVKLFAQRWSREVRKGDPYYNPNFSAAKEGFRISLKK